MIFLVSGLAGGSFDHLAEFGYPEIPLGPSDQHIRTPLRIF